VDGTAVAKVAKVANEAMMNEVLNANMAVSVGCWFVGWLVVVVVGVQVVPGRSITKDVWTLFLEFTSIIDPDFIDHDEDGELIFKVKTERKSN